MEDLLQNGLPSFWYLFDWAKLPGNALIVTLIFSLFGTVLLGRYTTKFGHLTMPMNFCGLFIGSIVSNWALETVWLPLEPRLQKPMVVSLCGMTIAALLMMVLLRTEQKGV
jgi:MFS-type transporter involved in bile tolerance (Atg22 family)